MLSRAVGTAAAIVHPYRIQASWLAIGGAALAGGTAPWAAIRLGAAAAFPYALVAVAEATLAVGCRRAWRHALAVTGVALASQVIAVIGALLAVVVNPDGAKADELRQLGVTPRLGYAVNLIYSSLAVALLTVMVLQARTHRGEPQTPWPPPDRTRPPNH